MSCQFCLCHRNGNVCFRCSLFSLSKLPYSPLMLVFIFLPSQFSLVVVDNSRRSYEANQNSALQRLNAVLCPYLKSLLTGQPHSRDATAPARRSALLPFSSPTSQVGVCRVPQQHRSVLITPMLICSSSTLAGAQPLEAISDYCHRGLWKHTKSATGPSTMQ